MTKYIAKLNHKNLGHDHLDLEKWYCIKKDFGDSVKLEGCNSIWPKTRLTIKESI